MFLCVCVCVCVCCVRACVAVCMLPACVGGCYLFVAIKLKLKIAPNLLVKERERATTTTQCSKETQGIAFLIFMHTQPTELKKIKK